MNLIDDYQRFQKHIEDYQLDDQRFARTPKVATNVAVGRTGQTPLLGMVDQQLVCYGLLDFSEAKSEYTRNEESVVLRSFSTDSRHLRKGHASRFLSQLPDYLHTYAPHVNELVLGVNVANPNALRLYEKVGFEDTGRKFHDKKGYQHIMSLAI